MSDGRGIEHTISIGEGSGVNHRWCFDGERSVEGGGDVNCVEVSVTVEF